MNFFQFIIDSINHIFALAAEANIIEQFKAVFPILYPRITEFFQGQFIQNITDLFN